jgi:flavodoxin
MKAIIYASVHHGNTKKVVEAIAKECEVELIDATQVKEKDLSGFDAVGFASGIYYSKFHQSVLNFAAVNLHQNTEVFYICTNGGNASFKSIESITKSKNAVEIGRFSCKGYDTFGPFKLIGGLAKGHPDDEDLANAVAFFKGLKREAGGH